MKKEEFGRNGYYHIQIPHARRLVLDLIFGLHFEGEEPFTDPDRLPQWTPDYDRVCHWLTDNKGKLRGLERRCQWRAQRLAS